MTARSRLLSGGNSPPSHRSPPSIDSPPTFETLDSDFVVIVAALLCALICVLGLAVVTRCAWIRHTGPRDPAAGFLPFATRPPPPSTAKSNKGLKKKVLKSLPKSTYGDNSEQAAKLSDCAICLAEFAAGEEIRVLTQCGHGFHVACIDTWLGCHSSCPSCRQILQVTSRCQRCGRSHAEEPRDNHVDSFLP